MNFLLNYIFTLHKRVIFFPKFDQRSQTWQVIQSSFPVIHKVGNVVIFCITYMVKSKILTVKKMGIEPWTLGI